MKKIIEKLKDESSVAAGLLTISLSLIGNTEICFTKWWHFLVAAFFIAFLFFLFFISIKIIREVYTRFFERPDTSIVLYDEINQVKKNVHLLYSIKKELNNPDTDSEYKNVLSNEFEDLRLITIKKIELIEESVQKSPSLKNIYTSKKQNMMTIYYNFCKNI